MKRSLFIGLILSLALHLVVVGVLALYRLPQQSLPLKESITFEILDQNPVTKSLEKPKNDKSKNESRQVVEQDPSLNHETPENARFFSEQDQKVKKETQASNQGAFQNLKTKNSKAGKTNESKKAVPKLDQLLATYDPTFEALKKHEAKIAQEAADAQKGGEVSKTDYLGKDVDRGIETLLNTREFKYFTYYNRIRKQLSQYWEPKVREKMTTLFRQGRTIATSQDRTTKLLIVLNSAGTLVTVQVLSDSGVRDLDEAAVEAFRSAAPFPNPPKGIIESDGTVKIRWDFVLET
ncbi:MAG: TonB family protein [Bdellovibrionaceae bacterium]|nr:TonB family protein [Pseudobdellovibrionaceae bacterium]